eukprot:5577177-Pyramimonas_sp.AAC.1
MEGLTATSKSVILSADFSTTKQAAKELSDASVILKAAAARRDQGLDRGGTSCTRRTAHAARRKRSFRWFTAVAKKLRKARTRQHVLEQGPTASSGARMELTEIRG